MKSPARISVQSVDSMLKSLQVLVRTVENVLEGRAFAAVSAPLSRSKVQVLRLLHQRGPQGATQIAGFLGVSRPAITQIVESMVQSRMIRRQRLTHDRRGVALSLTPRGRRIAEAVRDEHRHLIRSALRGLGPDTALRWAETLQSVASALAGAERAFRRFCLQCGAHADGSCVLVGGNTVCPFLDSNARTASGTGDRNRRNAFSARDPGAARSESKEGANAAHRRRARVVCD
ncbi:MAG: MarR family transcriptional regulator [Phycisphaerae bacterium]|nr:MarR family transcriptional regulator [Phycisphaerae bacterium]NUQ46241.1 MarR family transcriptional regulator [Phycisphaerae bacterium]